MTTICQMLSVLSVLLQFEYSFVLWWLAVALTIISGADYIRRGFAILYAVDNGRNHR